MNILIKSVTIPSFTQHSEEVDVWVKDGVFVAIGKHIDAPQAQMIDGKNQILSIGFFDLQANLGEPGYETKENLFSGCNAAAAGGFTGVATTPVSLPVTQSKTAIAFLKNQTQSTLVDLFPVAALSRDLLGKELNELYDMQQAGAVAFSNHQQPITDTGFMYRALLYAKGIQALIISYPEDAHLAGSAKINESAVSTFLGMKGIPTLAEEMAVARDLYLAEYTATRIHFTAISTRNAVNLIRVAKQKGVQVTCDVAAHHLVLTEQALLSFDSNYKVKPPLRGEDDVNALIEGLQDGTIDAIVSQHTPHEIEYKNVEFETAAYGMIALQTVLPLALQTSLDISLLMEKLAINPRKILNLPVPQIKVGEPANLVLFNPHQVWTFSSENNYSISQNSPFLNQPLTGKVNFICNKNQYQLC